jgi:hypothetical protein
MPPSIARSRAAVESVRPLDYKPPDSTPRLAVSCAFASTTKRHRDAGPIAYAAGLDLILVVLRRFEPCQKMQKPAIFSKVRKHSNSERLLRTFEITM